MLPIFVAPEVWPPHESPPDALLSRIGRLIAHHEVDVPTERTLPSRRLSWKAHCSSRCGVLFEFKHVNLSMLFFCRADVCQGFELLLAFSAVHFRVFYRLRTAGRVFSFELHRRMVRARDTDQTVVQLL